jgi:hypothetical protein
LNPDYAPALIWGVVLLIIVGAVVLAASPARKGGQGSSIPGAGAYGAVYDLLNEDKRNAIEMIVEDKAGYRDPEDAEGKPKAGK